MIHVISIEDGNVLSIRSFKDVTKAEECFKTWAREEINEDFTEEELDDCLIDGTVEADSHNLAINLVHSEVED